nr:hypothetical protein Itr_chr15CG12350 [Ipomoea trifida]GLL49633.1 hypothetical protein Itr_chr15CG12360 [Ipomoea trifida]
MAAMGDPGEFSNLLCYPAILWWRELGGHPSSPTFPCDGDLSSSIGGVQQGQGLYAASAMATKQKLRGGNGRRDDLAEAGDGDGSPARQCRASTFDDRGAPGRHPPPRRSTPFGRRPRHRKLWSLLRATFRAAT